MKSKEALTNYRPDISLTAPESQSQEIRVFINVAKAQNTQEIIDVKSAEAVACNEGSTTTSKQKSAA